MTVCSQMARRSPFLLVVAALALTSCGSSGPPPPDPQPIVHRLSADPALRAPLSLIDARSRSRVLSCVADGLRADADPARLAAYTRGDAAFSAIRARSGHAHPAQLLQRCVSSSIG